MSRVYKAKTTKTITADALLMQLRRNNDDIKYINNEPVYYFYNNGFSARGIDVSKEEYGYEIKMTACSNAADYLLGNEIFVTLKTMADAEMFDEDDEPVYQNKLFSDVDILNNTWNDFELLKELITQKKEIGLFGPHREFTINRIFGKKILALEGDKQDVTYQFSKMMLRCQYPPEEFEKGSSLLQITNNDNSTALLQIFANSKNMVLENVKRVILSSDEQSIYIEPKVLVQFLAPGWEQIDEYTVLARKLPDSLWKQYFESMKPFNTPL